MIVVSCVWEEIEMLRKVAAAAANSRCHLLRLATCRPSSEAVAEAAASELSCWEEWRRRVEG